MADDSRNQTVQQHIERFHRSLQEASTSFGTSFKAAVNTVGRICAQAQNQQNFLQPRLHPFAAVNLPFARSSESEGGKKRKKKRIPRPGERPQQEDGEEEKAPVAPKKPSEKKTKPKKQAAKRREDPAPAPIKDGDDKDTPEIVRALNNIREPAPKTDREAAAIGIALLHSRMNDKQREGLDKDLWGRIGRKLKARVGDKEMSLRRLAREAERDKAVKDISADEPTLRHRLRDEVMEELPGAVLRPYAPKMQLPPLEEDTLELDRLGEGHLFSPHRFLGHRLGGLHDFAWGMFGRISRARDILERSWAGRNPDEVLAQQEFYDDIINGANKMELTLMMVAERPLPLKQLREKFLERQLEVLSVLPEGSDDPQKAQISSSHALTLARIKRQCTVDAFSKCGLIDSKGRVIPDTKLILSIGPQWQLSAEAITPGTLKEQRSVFLGHWVDKPFAQGVLENFLGLPPVDPIGKTSVGNGMLYVANGFDFEDPAASSNPNQFYNPDDGLAPLPETSIAAEGVPMSSDLFSVSECYQPSLLGEIRRRKAAQA